jgi:glc operon protein GlcG
VDDGGPLRSLQRLDDTMTESIEIVIEKAQTALTFKRPSKALEEALVTKNRTPILKLPGTIPIEGGVPIIVNETVIGVISVSGVTPQQEGQITKTGADTLAKILGQEARGEPQSGTAVRWRLAGATGGGLKGLEEADARQGCSTCGLAQGQREE